MMALLARDRDHEREVRASLDADFAAGKLGIYNGWLVDLEHLVDDGTGRLFPEPLVNLVVVIDASAFPDGRRPL
jgi:hypothetical protein